MAHVQFTPHLRRQVECTPCEAQGATLRAVLENLFTQQPTVKSYIVDEHFRLRAHVTIFNGGRIAQDRIHQSDPVSTDTEISIMQALSGG